MKAMMMVVAALLATTAWAGGPIRTMPIAHCAAKVKCPNGEMIQCLVYSADGNYCHERTYEDRIYCEGYDPDGIWVAVEQVCGTDRL